MLTEPEYTSVSELSQFIRMLANPANKASLSHMQKYTSLCFNLCGAASLGQELPKEAVAQVATLLAATKAALRATREARGFAPTPYCNMGVDVARCRLGIYE
jgi:hypothetical protein